MTEQQMDFFRIAFWVIFIALVPFIAIPVGITLWLFVRHLDKVNERMAEDFRKRQETQQ